ncbi:hydroxyacid dehydrogenase [Kineosporia succinea]|uniref:Phosphoglycerate dehydrogenase-like enzyme n=1 Tax=Kineosporia succinea TaxID=84632 RepID=A0ABT9PD66_9ACTN|nr:hydroxyacid dehydrogenase [Kineosporia succinea]MDP9830668.1 phosphoglycerate dehydrogenase-like enzyme [Kineosporia succinea]
MTRARVVMDPELWARQSSAAHRARLHELAVVDSPTCVAGFEGLDDVEVLITGWGTPTLDAAALDRLPALRAVLHSAGTVRRLTTPAVWERGIQVSSGAAVNAEPVAQFTLAAVLMAGKKAPFLAAHDGLTWSSAAREVYGPLGNAALTIGIVGHSHIGRRVLELVRTVLPDARCLVSDPFADPRQLRGAEAAPLPEMLPQLDILTIHAPELPSTRHLIGAGELARLPDHSTIINTARGSLIDTSALEAECGSGRLNAILDVTDPEPLPARSRLRNLPNVMITPHIAGSTGSETLRMTDAVLDELARYMAGQPLARPVRQEDLVHSA